MLGFFIKPRHARPRSVVDPVRVGRLQSPFIVADEDDGDIRPLKDDSVDDDQAGSGQAEDFARRTALAAQLISLAKQRDMTRSFGVGRGMVPQNQSGRGLAEEFVKRAGQANQLITLAKQADALAFGPVGTTVSNRLHEQFNNNPQWRSGFAGEKHIALPTREGLTRANFAGPGTKIATRLARGDIGVDGPKGVDAAARRHDIAYTRANNIADIRKADEVFIKDVNTSTQSGLVKAIVRNAMKAKTFAEDFGIVSPKVFSFPGQGSGVLNIARDKIAAALEDLPMAALKRRLLTGSSDPQLGVLPRVADDVAQFLIKSSA